MAGSTLNRYLSQLGSVYKCAKRLKLVPRAFIPPTRGIERSPERADPERYLRAEDSRCTSNYSLLAVYLRANGHDAVPLKRANEIDGRT